MSDCKVDIGDGAMMHQSGLGEADGSCWVELTFTGGDKLRIEATIPDALGDLAKVLLDKEKHVKQLLRQPRAVRQQC